MHVKIWVNNLFKEQVNSLWQYSYIPTSKLYSDVQVKIKDRIKDQSLSFLELSATFSAWHQELPGHPSVAPVSVFITHAVQELCLFPPLCLLQLKKILEISMWLTSHMICTRSLTENPPCHALYPTEISPCPYCYTKGREDNLPHY